jgi:pyruvate,water dikinase
MLSGTRPGSTLGQAPDLPPALREPLIAAYQRLGMLCGTAQPCVAIRSSAVDEDGSSASFAGQHETYLNVSGEAAIAPAVVRCWESAFTGRAHAYRDRHGLAAATPQLAVLVQHLIPADVSAVVFSADPVSGSREEVLITASWGLGESIVGGTVTPDVYTVRKEDLLILSRRISDKLLMAVPAPGGTREVAVPRFLQRRSALDDTQVCAMARLALDLEVAMGRAVDLECAWKAGELFLLQCRPITTLH